MKCGKHTYGEPTILDWQQGTKCEIGAFCSIAENVLIYLGGNHRSDFVTTFPLQKDFENGPRIEGHPGTNGDVIIGNDVWLGNDCCIMSGVAIGDGAIVAARSVVTHSVEPYTLVAGNPARGKKLRFLPWQIRALLEIKWWDWSDAKIVRFMPLMLNTNIERFITEAENEQRTGRYFSLPEVQRAVVAG